MNKKSARDLVESMTLDPSAITATPGDRSRLFFSEDSARRCLRSFDQACFIAELMVRGLFVQPIVSRQLCEIWRIDKQQMKLLVEVAYEELAQISTLDSTALAKEAVARLGNLYAEALKNYHHNEVDEPRLALRWHEAAADIAMKIATLTGKPEQATPGSAPTFLVQLVEPRRPERAEGY